MSIFKISPKDKKTLINAIIAVAITAGAIVAYNLIFNN